MNLANRYDLMIVSSKGVSVTAARRLIDDVCGDHDLPLFVLHDFDVAGFLILGTLQRDTRRYQFSNAVEVVDLGLRLADIEGLEREPAAATKTSAEHPARAARRERRDGCGDRHPAQRARRAQRHDQRRPGRNDRAKLKAYGLKKVVPDDDLLAETYRAFHRSQQLRERFEEMEEEFDEEADAVEIPEDLKQRVRAILAEHDDLRWDDAIQVVLDETQLYRVRAEKEKAKKKSGDFTSAATTKRGGRMSAQLTIEPRGGAMSRERLPNRRGALSFAVDCAGLSYTSPPAIFDDGRLAELFVSNHKTAATPTLPRGTRPSSPSLALQFGAPAAVIRAALLRDHVGRPVSPIGAALDALAGEAAT